jgi:hypothetical protein
MTTPTFTPEQRDRAAAILRAMGQLWTVRADGMGYKRNSKKYREARLDFLSGCIATVEAQRTAYAAFPLTQQDMDCLLNLITTRAWVCSIRPEMDPFQE